MDVKFVSVKTSSPQIRRIHVPNFWRWIIYKESTENSDKTRTKIQIQRIQNKNTTVFIPDRLTNKIFLHTSTKCVRPSVTFRTSYLDFSIVAFRETTSTEHTISVLFISFRWTVSWVSECDGVSDGAGSRQTLLLLLFEGPRRSCGIRKVLRPATSTQVFLGFPVPRSKCWDGSQDSKLPLHASHVALPT